MPYTVATEPETRNLKFQESLVANKRSALKAHRVSERKHARNRAVRSALRTFVKRARTEALSGAVEEATALVGAAAKHLDEAAGKGIIHRNQAARRKSRLMHALNLAAQRQTEPEPEARPTRRRATRETAAAAPAATTRARTTTRRAPARAATTRTTTPKAEAPPAEEKPAATPTRRRRTPTPKKEDAS
jgi:small subunit ribosomal protein S20